MAILLGLLGSSRAIAQQQAPLWQRAFAVNNASSSYVEAVASDSVGNMYLAGSFGGTARLGSFTLTASGNSDGFIAKWSPATNTFIWAQRWGGVDYDGVHSMAVRGTTLYLTGSATGNGVQIGTLPAVNCAQTDAVVIKLVDAGASSSFVWAYRAGSTTTDRGESIAATADGIYVAGNSAGQYAYFNPFTVFYASYQGAFIAKLIDEGNSARVVWLKGLNGDSSTFLYTLSTTANKGIYVGGETTSNILPFGTQRLVKPAGVSGTYAFAAKLTDQDSTSTWNWVQGIGSQGTASGRTRVRRVRATANAVYATGSFTDATINVGPVVLNTFANPLPNQQEDIFLTKLSDNGANATVAWAMSLGGNSYDAPGDLLVEGASLYLAGSFWTTVSLGATSLGSIGRADAFVAKLADTGTAANVVWAQRGGGNGSEFAGTLARHDSTLFVGGSFAGFLGRTASFGSYTVAGPSNSSATNGYGFAAVLGTNGRALPTATRPALAATAELYPNPTHNAVTVLLPSAMAAETSVINVLNNLGQIVMVRHQLPNTRQVDLQLGQLPAGVYTIQIMLGKQMVVKRLTVI